MATYMLTLFVTLDFYLYYKNKHPNEWTFHRFIRSSKHPSPNGDIFSLSKIIRDYDTNNGFDVF